MAKTKMTHPAVTGPARAQSARKSAGGKRTRVAPHMSSLKKPPLTGGIKKPHRSRRDMVALCSINRKTYDDIKDDPLDPDYKPAVPLDLTQLPEASMERRWQYFQLAESLRVLPANHNPDDEEATYSKFVNGLQNKFGLEPKRSMPSGTPNQTYYETDYGIWVSTILQYKNNKHRIATEKTNDPAKRDFWTKNHGTASTLANEVRAIRKRVPGKPIVIFGGGRGWTDYTKRGTSEWKEPVGHIAPMILVPTGNGYRAIIKDSNSILDDITRVKSVHQQFLKDLGGIKEVELVGLLKYEEDCLDTECLRECYKVLGNILDGLYIWRWDLREYTRKFSVFGTHEIFPK